VCLQPSGAKHECLQLQVALISFCALAVQAKVMLHHQAVKGKVVQHLWKPRAKHQATIFQRSMGRGFGGTYRATAAIASKSHMLHGLLTCNVKDANLLLLKGSSFAQTWHQ